MYYSEIPTPLGTLHGLADTHTLLGLYYADQTSSPDLTPFKSSPDNAILQAARHQIQAYFNNPLYEFDLPLSPQITEFQQRVLSVLQRIPAGTTLSYQQVADALGQPTATRAVASAIAKNPLIIVIPCHRVIGQDGSLRGFAAGLERKQQLLNLEQERF